MSADTSIRVFGASETAVDRQRIARSLRRCCWPVGKAKVSRTGNPSAFETVYCCDPTEARLPFCPVHADDALGRDLERAA